ncbi:zinc finger protein 572-like isoform X2 [Poeciliopsis prolifica]|nr:zinc finger protein 572-like isoform X2 [Poeciliopsis prolifica]
MAAGPCSVQIKPEPGDDVAIQCFPLLKKLSVKLTDCRAWLEGRDFLSLDDHPELRPWRATNSGRRMAYCPMCQRGFYKLAHLEAHLWTHRGQNPNQCWECGKTYPTLMSLVLHQQVHGRSEPYAAPTATAPSP